jgi:hypothetical protein
MALNDQNQVPAQLEPIGSWGSRDVPVVVKPVWFKFFVSLSAIAQNIIDGVLGFTVENNITAAGATQGTAALLETEWSVVTTTPVNSGVLLKEFGPGVPQTVFNFGANSLKVYPFSGAQIDALGINGPYALASAKMQTFYQTDNLQFHSTQLG